MNEGTIRLCCRLLVQPTAFSASLCRYITVVDVTSNILFESVEYGNYVQADKTIDQIVTSVDGWDSCINEIPPIKGRLTQRIRKPAPAIPIAWQAAVQEQSMPLYRRFIAT